MSRDKGKRGECEVARLLRAHGFDGHRGQQFHGGKDSPDVTGLPGAHIEVKRTERFSLYEALEQSEGDSGPDEIPLVFHRRNEKRWTVVLDADEFLRIYARAIGAK